MIRVRVRVRQGLTQGLTQGARGLTLTPCDYPNQVRGTRYEVRCEARVSGAIVSSAALTNVARLDLVGVEDLDPIPVLLPLPYPYP